jgi:hypothetical protein
VVTFRITALLLALQVLAGRVSRTAAAAGGASLARSSDQIRLQTSYDLNQRTFGVCRAR